VLLRYGANVGWISSEWVAQCGVKLTDLDWFSFRSTAAASAFVDEAGRGLPKSYKKVEPYFGKRHVVMQSHENPWGGVGVYGNKWLSGLQSFSTDKDKRLKVVREFANAQEAVEAFQSAEVERLKEGNRLTAFWLADVADVPLEDSVRSPQP